MRLLFIEWKSIGNDFIIKEFKKYGIDIVMYPFPTDGIDANSDETLATDIARTIIKEETDIVFSFNYFPIVAIAANACKNKYISWTYDSPYSFLYSKTITLPGNILFVFDKEQVEKLNNLGANNVYYLPLCAPVDVYDKMIPTKHDHLYFDSAISMIGGMYSEEKQDLFSKYINADQFLNGYLEGLIRSQQNIYGTSILELGLTENIMELLDKCCPIMTNDTGMETQAWVIANYILARKLTSYERFEYMDLAGKYFTNVSLYTREKTPTLKNVTNKGRLDYYNHMPYAMKCSDINLNITLRSIVNAIPLRVFDIMGCGGFCLTNYQGEMLDYFIPGEDFDYFDSKESFVNKCDYYLKNPAERKQISQNGYSKIKQYHTYKNRVESILEHL